MARSLAVVVLCMCIAVAFAADLRQLIAERAGAAPGPQRAGGVAQKGNGDLDSANSWGYGWGGPWGGYGGWGFGGYGGYGPWGYGFGGPYGYGGWW